MQQLLKEHYLDVDYIVKICHVSPRTARRWLTGQSEPSPAMVRLLRLELTGRIMPESWPHYWRFNHLDLLEAERCYPASSWQTISWFNFTTMAWFESVRMIPPVVRRIDELLARQPALPSADIISLSQYRDELESQEKKYAQVMESGQTREETLAAERNKHR